VKKNKKLSDAHGEVHLPLIFFFGKKHKKMVCEAHGQTASVNRYLVGVSPTPLTRIARVSGGILHTSGG